MKEKLLNIIGKPFMYGTTWCDLAHLDRLVNSQSICNIISTEYDSEIKNVRILGYSAETFDGGLTKCSIRVEETDGEQLFLDLEKITSIKAEKIISRNKKITAVIATMLICFGVYKIVKK